MLNMALDMLEVASAMVLPAPTKGAANGGPQAQLPVRLRIGIHSVRASHRQRCLRAAQASAACAARISVSCSERFACATALLLCPHRGPPAPA